MVSTICSQRYSHRRASAVLSAFKHLFALNPLNALNALPAYRSLTPNALLDERSKTTITAKQKAETQQATLRGLGRIAAGAAADALWVKCDTMAGSFGGTDEHASKQRVMQWG